MIVLVRLAILLVVLLAKEHLLLAVLAEDITMVYSVLLAIVLVRLAMLLVASPAKEQIILHAVQVEDTTLEHLVLRAMLLVRLAMLQVVLLAKEQILHAVLVEGLITEHHALMLHAILLVRLATLLVVLLAKEPTLLVVLLVNITMVRSVMIVLLTVQRVPARMYVQAAQTAVKLPLNVAHQTRTTTTRTVNVSAMTPIKQPSLAVSA